MYLLSGSFGEGFVTYYRIRGILDVSPRALFSSREDVPISDVVDIQQFGADSSKKFGETAALGGVGLAVGSLLGPVGALAGLAAGAMAGGKKSHVTFLCKLRDGRNFVARASVEDFGEFWAAYQNAIPTASLTTATTRAVKPAKTDRKAFTKRKKRAGVLPGRESAEAPEAECSHYLVLKADVSATKRVKHHSILADLLTYAQKINLLKWRHLSTPETKCIGTPE